jgi:hypothetical protein
VHLPQQERQVTMRRRLLMLLCALLIWAGVAATATAAIAAPVAPAHPAAAAAPVAPAHPAAAAAPVAPAHLAISPITYQHPAGCWNNIGVDIPTHVAYECLYAIPHVGLLYWVQNLYAISYYFHPFPPGEMVVYEVYFKLPGTSWPGIIPSSQNPLPSTPGNEPTPPRDNGRLIALADGCVVQAPTDIGPPPTTCLPTHLGGQPTGPVRTMTTNEQNSINGFWSMFTLASHIPEAAW